MIGTHMTRGYKDMREPDWNDKFREWMGDHDDHWLWYVALFGLIIYWQYFT